MPTPPIRIVTDTKIPGVTNPFHQAPPQVDDIRLGTWDKANIIERKDARDLPLPTGSAGLALTAPPSYEDFSTDNGTQSWNNYVQFLTATIREIWRVLEAGGRTAIVVDPRPGIGHLPNEAVVHSLLQQEGFILRGSIVWAKSHTPHPLNSAVLRGPHDPPIIGITERIILASKLTSFRRNTPAERRDIGMPADNNITVTEWASNRIDLWTIPAPDPGPFIHNYPFPVELAERIIQTHTYQGELVVDPMCGTGTTALAATRLNRHFYACDTDTKAVATARKRLDAHTTQAATAKQQSSQTAPQPTYEQLDLTQDHTA